MDLVYVQWHSGWNFTDLVWHNEVVMMLDRLCLPRHSVYCAMYKVTFTFTTLQGAVALFDMIEYYQSATRLNISYNRNVGPRGWQAFARMLKKVWTQLFVSLHWGQWVGSWTGNILMSATVE